MKNVIAFLIVVGLCVLCLGQGAASAPATPYGLPDGLYSEVTVPEGVIVAELFYKKTPMTVASHVGLAEGTLGPRKGQPFYDGNTFFRVVANFVVQGGSGAPGPGGRGAGYEFPDEIVPGLRHDGAGTLQMANGGPDTNGSQFCFMLSDQTGLNYNHTVFGHVVRGLDVLPQIKQGDAMQVKILRIGAEAQAFKADEATFNALVAKAKRFDGPRTPGPDAFLDDPDGIIGTAGRGSNFLQFKLANFERFTGERIMARVYAHTPAEAQGDREEACLKDLAEKLKVSDQGALVTYFQDQNKWNVRVGAASQASFMAGPRKADGTKDPATARATMAEAMTEFMAQIAPAGRGRGPATTAATTTAPATGRGRGRGAGAPGVANRLSVVLDNLIFRLEPAAGDVK